nr:hypothetical protein Iba_chr03dCG3520 [Ipomoea batatas]
MHISVEIFKEEAELEDDCDVHSIATGRCPPVFPPVSVKQESALIQCCSFNLCFGRLEDKEDAGFFTTGLETTGPADKYVLERVILIKTGILDFLPNLFSPTTTKSASSIFLLLREDSPTFSFPFREGGSKGTCINGIDKAGLGIGNFETNSDTKAVEDGGTDSKIGQFRSEIGILGGTEPAGASTKREPNWIEGAAENMGSADRDRNLSD